MTATWQDRSGPTVLVRGIIELVFGGVTNGRSLQEGYMSLTQKQLQKIEARLHEERDRLASELPEFTGPESAEDGEAEADEISKSPTDEADWGADVARKELEASIATRRSAEIAEIDAALERLSTSPETFGLDENSGEPIPFARLDIIPWARTTV